MSSVAAESVQATTYGVERAKQETGALHDTTNATAAEPHDDFHAKVDAAAEQARVKKEAAVAEGKADVEEAKASTASYLNQARNLVGVALDKAQSYVEAGQERLGATTTHSTAHVRSTGTEGPKAGGFTSTLTGAAVSALETTKGVLATAQAQLAAPGRGAHAAAKPHVESAQATVQPHVDSAAASVKQQAENAQATIQPHVDATTAAAKPHVEAVKHALPNSVAKASTPSPMAVTAGSHTSNETAAAPNQVTSPSTISYPKDPKTEAHHVTTEGDAAPPEKVEDKAVNKLADELTSTKITDVSPATQTH